MVERKRKYEGKVSRAQELVKAGFDGLVAEIQSGHTEHFLDYLSFLSRFHKYSSHNQMLIYQQKPDATLVAGYRRWQKLGYQVRRGEKGINIFAPVIIKEKTDEDGVEKERKRLVGYKVVNVFDVSQLVSRPEDPWEVHELPDDAGDKLDIVSEAIGNEGIEINEAPMEFGTRGSAVYGQEAPFILLKEGLDSRSQIHVLVHEWAHHKLHADAESREQFSRPVREAQVESVSYIVSNYLGVPNPHSADYILHYRNDADVLIANMEIIQKTSHRMIAEIEEVTRS